MNNTVTLKKAYEEKNSKIIEIMIILSCIFSNISQLPHYPISDIAKNLSAFMWIITIFITFLLFNKKIILNKLLYLTPLFIFDTLLIFMTILTEKNYFSSVLIYPVHLSAFIYLIGYICGQFLSEKSIIKISNYYILTSLIVALYIFFNYFFGKNWIHSNLYAYTSKNSISQILLFASILAFIYGFFNKKFLKMPIVFLLLYITFILQSRAVIIGMFIIILYTIFFVLKNNLVKCWSVLILSFLIFLIFTVKPLYEIIIEKMLLNNISGEGLNAISSGRINQFLSFFDSFLISPLTGNGISRIESFPLSALISFGLFAGSFIIIFALIPLIISLKDMIKKNSSSLLHILTMFSISSVSNCFFEEQAPFGPGVKCYFLWLIFGIYIAFRERKKNDA